MKKTIKQNILETLIELNRPLAEHEIWQYFQPRGILSNGHCISARLNELQRSGVLGSRFREGKNYKEWYLREISATASKSDKEETPGVKMVNNIKTNSQTNGLGRLGLPGVSEKGQLNFL